MLNRLAFILICSTLFTSVNAQRIEGISRPYRFEIDKMIAMEGKSFSTTFKIIPFKTRIIDQMEIEIASWYHEIGYKYENHDDFQKKLKNEIDRIQPLVINQVGSEVISVSRPDLFFIPEELKFEIVFNGFESIEIEVPISQIEEFKENFSRLTYNDERISYNEYDQFIITEINIYDPISNAIYSYTRPTQDDIRTPLFNVSLPEID